MKFTILLLMTVAITSAQNKKIDFFGTEFNVNNACTVKESSIKYDKNALIWTDAPPTIMRGTMISMIKSKLKDKKMKEVRNDDLKATLLKVIWKGKFSQYKKADNDSIMNFVQLYGDYKNEERLLIMVYKTSKQEPFRVPAYFDFLVR